MGAKNCQPVSATLINLSFTEEAPGGNQGATTSQAGFLSQASRQSLLVYFFGTGDREKEIGQMCCLSEGRLVNHLRQGSSAILRDNKGACGDF